MNPLILGMTLVNFVNSVCNFPFAYDIWAENNGRYTERFCLCISSLVTTFRQFREIFVFHLRSTIEKLAQNAEKDGCENILKF